LRQKKGKQKVWNVKERREFGSKKREGVESVQNTFLLSTKIYRERSQKDKKVWKGEEKRDRWRKQQRRNIKKKKLPCRMTGLTRVQIDRQSQEQL